MTKYKLLKKYPGIPENWYEGIEIVKIKYNVLANKNFYFTEDKNALHCILFPDEVENFPEFWQKVKEKDFEIMKVKIEGTVYQKQNDGEPYFNVDGRKFFERFHEDNLPRLKYRDIIMEVKRLRDGEIFKVGDEIKTSVSDSYCSIYGFKTDHEGNLKVDCTHSFLAHKKMINLFQNMERKKISYPVGIKVFNSNTKNTYIKKEDGWYKEPEKTAYTDKDISKLTFLSLIG